MLPDVNCDMGEGMASDEAIMPFINSASIACGFHAGNSEMIRRTIDLAMLHGVRTGAHPSYRDKANFGRKEMHLPPDRIYALVIEQLIKVDLIARERGARLYHVKPHGALYNMAARDQVIARTIATVIKDFDPGLVLYGLSGSYLVKEAHAMGLRTANEAFADRRYRDDGSLVPRSEAGALISDEATMTEQVRALMGPGKVITVSGRPLSLDVDTICIHGDGPNALCFARAIHKLKKELAPC